MRACVLCLFAPANPLHLGRVSSSGGALAITRTDGAMANFTSGFSLPTEADPIKGSIALFPCPRSMMPSTWPMAFRWSV